MNVLNLWYLVLHSGIGRISGRSSDKRQQLSDLLDLLCITAYFRQNQIKMRILFYIGQVL